MTTLSSFLARPLACLAIATVLLSQPAFTAEAGEPASDLKDLVSRIQDKLEHSKGDRAQALEPELKEFDALLEKYKDQKTDDVAQIALMRAVLYFEVLTNTPKSIELVQQVKKDFPDTKQGKQADSIIQAIHQREETQKMQQSLAVGAKFPDFDEKDVNDKPLSVAIYKGKLVLVDFWATWCGPCVRELPNVLKTYEAHHEKGFEIIGISLDSKKETLTSFTEQHKMPWQQYFDGKGWGNKLAGKYGVSSIPATFLLDGEGKIIGRNLRGPDLEEAVAKALGGQK